MNPTPSASAGSTYDETPYPAAAFAHTHPHKLAAMGRLFGLAAVDPDRARVLELGCANGANLLPMAQLAPEGRFLGIDASARQVEQGQQAIAAAGLRNVELRHQDILDFPAAEGAFDYIIVHGIFSWVPDSVREKILAICRDHLSENGVAYISYNAFPGWGMRMALRDMMLFHTSQFADPKMKVQQTRALTAFLSESVPTENNPFGLLLKQELEAMKGYDDNYLRHDLLEENNQPFYFHQFMRRAGAVGLQYLSETSLSQMLPTNFPDKIRELLAKLNSNALATEQYMDFVRNRNFRQTLLCHARAKLTRQLTPDAMRPFYFDSRFAKVEAPGVDLTPGVPQEFKLRGQGTSAANSNLPFPKALFDTLGDCAIARCSFAEILETVRQKTVPWPLAAEGPQRAAAEEAGLAENLMFLYGKGLVDIFAAPAPLDLRLADKPRATPLARFEALHRPKVVNRTHASFTFDALARVILSACDGEHDFNGIVEELLAGVRAGRLAVSENNARLADEGRLRQVLEARARDVLPRLARAGFFGA